MTNKELLYIEDALGHEEFLKNNACKASRKSARSRNSRPGFFRRPPRKQVV